ncbi:MAG: methyl-accepting chemotaxis protein [Gammaproteobacteria bacterium]|nr:methyl-accepting chemotaxis protein [Gammaproteobacteria bacterium]MCF6364207.1 methyl-accepting chemotaxis protein [Gammaproteobacteria bacterium]
MGNFSSNSFIKRLSIRAKINLALGSIFSLLLVLVTSNEVNHERERLMDRAEYEVKETTTFYFDSLNTMMLTGTMDQRNILRNKILARETIVEARVIRGQPVIDQYGAGSEEEAPRDELDRKGLQGEESIEILETAGQRVLTAVVPFLATENTRGVNCLKCHEVPRGAVNGAVRISYSLAEIDQAVQRQFWLILGINLSFFVLGLVLINLLLKSWVITPLLHISDVVKRRAKGDSTIRANLDSDDEIGGLARAFNNMADNVNAVTDREHNATETLRRQIDHLLEAINRVAEGDYSAKIELDVQGEDAVAELGESLQIMINYIAISSEQKREEVETLECKVDAILQVVTLAAQGDLTGEVAIDGDDAIGKLAQGVQSMVNNLNALVSQVQRSGIQVTSSATEIAATAKQQEATISEQASTTNQIAATATEISATTKELENTIDEVAEVAERTTRSAANGQKELGNMESTMQQIVDAAGSIASKFEVLNEKARNINSVVTTITKVADQTNLLSLNAAIEAEKAGEYGLGFSVVAKEIRRLADQTAVATLDIEQMVKEMQSAVSAGVLSMEKFSIQVRNSAKDVNEVSAQLAQIIAEVQTLTPRFESVQEGMHFQSQGAQQIKMAMMQLSESAQQTVDSIRHSNAAIDQLNDAAQSMQSSVSKLRVNKSHR